MGDPSDLSGANTAVRGTEIAPSGPMQKPPDLSIVVPVLNEEDNVAGVVTQVRQALEDSFSWELLFVNDGSTDSTAARVSELAILDPRIRLLTLAARFGQSAAMQAGFDHALGRVVVTMDGDLQNDPLDIPRLVEKLDEGFDLVAGYRMRRQDKWLTRKFPSQIANRVIRWITGVPIRDNGCSLKAYRRGLLERMRLYSDLHRFIPALAAGTAGARITELEVRHHPRTAGESSYGLSRIWQVVIDLFTIKMIRSFRLRPLQLFLRLALPPALVASAMVGARLLTNAPALRSLSFATVVLLLVALSAYLLVLGLLAESFVRLKTRGRGTMASTATEWVS